MPECMPELICPENLRSVLIITNHSCYRFYSNTVIFDDQPVKYYLKTRSEAPYSEEQIVTEVSSLGSTQGGKISDF